MHESDSEAELKYQAEKAAETALQKLSARSFTLALAESCTAGLISALLAEIPGASKTLFGSYVCYTKEAKVSMLGLDKDALDEHGLVSGETAYSMAAGALKKSGADLAAAVTGLAGPSGDGSRAAVGTVWVSTAIRDGKTTAREFHFSGSRNAVRTRSAIAALELIDEILTSTS